MHHTRPLLRILEETGAFLPQEGGGHMKMVVVTAPKALAGFLKKVFHI